MNYLFCSYGSKWKSIPSLKYLGKNFICEPATIKFHRNDKIFHDVTEKSVFCIRCINRQIGVKVREAGCCTKCPGFESRVRHECQTVRPWPAQWPVL